MDDDRKHPRGPNRGRPKEGGRAKEGGREARSSRPVGGRPARKPFDPGNHEGGPGPKGRGGRNAFAAPDAQAPLRKQAGARLQSPEGKVAKGNFGPKKRAWHDDGAARSTDAAKRPALRSSGFKSQEGKKRSYGRKTHDRAAGPGPVASEPPKGRPRGPAELEGPAAGERIAKRLARAGIASRRDAEELIGAGRVTVNGRKLASPAVNVKAEDEIAVDGLAIPPIERTRLFLFHKPAGLVTTNRDPEGRRTVFDALPADLPRLLTVGRLDINTEGLLLLTNDGGLSRVLELPSTGWLRRYRVRVHGKVDEKALAALKDGIAVNGVFYGSIEASLDREQGSNAWVTLGLREGKNREVKNVLGALGLEVSRLIRVSYGPFQLGELPEGHVLEVKGRMLREQLGERLIAEAEANFEAPVLNHFPNQPVKRGSAARPPEPERPRSGRDGERGRIGEGGLIKKRKRREEARDDALGRLTTRPDREPREPGRARQAKPEAAKRASSAGRDRRNEPIAPPGSRKSNVWMAPGARPAGKGQDRAGEKPGGARPGGPPKRPKGGGRDADRRR